MRHRETPWHCRIVAALTLSYVFSPIQLIPNFLPVVGQMDDVLVAYVGLRLLRWITLKGLLEQCGGITSNEITRANTTADEMA
jgi:uncharacterized membrane protein YkvA (DUF1232 family)